MITKFDKYEKIDEGWKNDMAAILFLILTPIFSNIGTDSRNLMYDQKYIENYIKTMNIANNDFFVQNVVRDFKDYVMKNNKILNKQQVIAKIDKTPIVYRKNDAISYALYKMAKESSKGDPLCWCSTTNTGESVIFLSKDASYNSIFHELSHAIESVVKVDPRILNGFNFNYNRKQVGILFNCITDFEYSLKSDPTRDKKYLSNPSEVWARLNNLKMFLYKHKFLNSPNDEISEEILQKIIVGDFYKSLNEKDKMIFRNSDFIQILIFIDLNKYMKINQFVQNVIKNNPNLA
jgi:hypothetical protein